LFFLKLFSPCIISKSFKWFIKISMCIWLPFNSSFCPDSLSHINNISYNFHALRMNSFVLWGRHCNYTLHKHSLNTNTLKYTWIHTVNTSNTAQFTMFRSSNCYRNLQMF
jgi:hypothetical protein